MVEKATPLEMHLGRRLYNAQEKADLLSDIYKKDPGTNVSFFDGDEKLRSIKLTRGLVNLAYRAVFDFYGQLKEMDRQQAAEVIIFEARKEYAKKKDGIIKELPEHKIVGFGIKIIYEDGGKEIIDGMDEWVANLLLADIGVDASWNGKRVIRARIVKEN